MIKTLFSQTFNLFSLFPLLFERQKIEGLFFYYLFLASQTILGDQCIIFFIFQPNFFSIKKYFTLYNHIAIFSPGINTLCVIVNTIKIVCNLFRVSQIWAFFDLTNSTRQWHDCKVLILCVIKVYLPIRICTE